MVLDLSNTGKIDSPRQFELTAWDPSAETDMQALKDVFATSHNGKLDAGDADWASFKVMVTNPDGTTTLEGLSQLGITSIDLTANKNMIVLPDGSRIEGQTTFTKSDGTAGAAADVAPSFDHEGFVTQQTTSMRYERIEAFADFTIGEVKKIFSRLTHMGGAIPRGRQYWKSQGRRTTVASDGRLAEHGCAATGNRVPLMAGRTMVRDQNA